MRCISVVVLCYAAQVHADELEVNHVNDIQEISINLPPLHFTDLDKTTLAGAANVPFPQSRPILPESSMMIERPFYQSNLAFTPPGVVPAPQVGYDELLLKRYESTKSAPEVRFVGVEPVKPKVKSFVSDATARTQAAPKTKEVEKQPPSQESPDKPPTVAQSPPALKVPEPPAVKAPEPPAFKAPEPPAFKAPEPPAFKAPETPSVETPSVPSTAGLNAGAAAAAIGTVIGGVGVTAATSAAKNLLKPKSAEQLALQRGDPLPGQFDASSAILAVPLVVGVGAASILGGVEKPPVASAPAVTAKVVEAAPKAPPAPAPPAKIEPAKETPKIEAVKEAPKTEAPKAEAPKVTPPVVAPTETQKAEAPKVTPPAKEAPKTEAPKEEAKLDPAPSSQTPSSIDSSQLAAGAAVAAAAGGAALVANKPQEEEETTSPSPETDGAAEGASERPPSDEIDSGDKLDNLLARNFPALSITAAVLFGLFAGAGGTMLALSFLRQTSTNGLEELLLSA